MRFKFIVVSVVIMTAFAGAADAAWDGLSDRFSGSISKEMRNALKLYDAGMFSRSSMSSCVRPAVDMAVMSASFAPSR